MDYSIEEFHRAAVVLLGRINTVLNQLLWSGMQICLPPSPLNAPFGSIYVMRAFSLSFLATPASFVARGKMVFILLQFVTLSIT